MLKKLLQTDRSFTTLLIRLMVGGVFLSEGIQKFLFPAIRGAGRFEKIGLPSPDFLGSFVGTFEILSGAFILLGLFTRLAALPTLIIMIVAIYTTKIDILVSQGIWEMLHAARTDWSMLY
jgi:putative oxidoreductase